MNHQTLMTIAEMSNYKETGRLEEVERLSAELARTWPEAVRSFEYGRSAEGRVMRGLLVSRTGALTPGALRCANCLEIPRRIGCWSGLRCSSSPHSTRTVTSASGAGIAPIKVARLRPAGGRRRKISTSIATT